MRLFYFNQNALQYLKTNCSSLIPMYNRPTNEWVFEEFKDINPFLEFKNKAKSFELDMSEDKPSETDIKNIKILHGNLSFLSRSEATEERLWAGFAHTNFWEYMQYRWKDTVNETKILNRYFFRLKEQKRAFFVNTLSRLWWIGELVHDKEKENPYERIEAIGNDLLGRSLFLFSSKFTSNPKILHSLLDSILIYQSNNEKLTNENFSEILRYMNLLGGIYLLDNLSEEDIKNKLGTYMNKNF